MLIGIDGNEANVEKKLGVGEYAYRLLVEFHKNVQADTQFVIYLKKPPLPDMPAEKGNWKYRVLISTPAWTQVRLPLDLYTHRSRPDVFFTPTHYAPRFSPIPTVVAILDVSYLLYPELFRKKDLYKLVRWSAYSIKNASQVLTISESTKGDIIKYYKVKSDRIVVTYPGLKSGENSKMTDLKAICKKYGISEKYILFVGTLQPRKNIERLIAAFAKVIERKKEFKNLELAVIGKKGWLYEPILAAPKKYGVGDNVLFLDFVPDDDLPAFYKNALCFVLPSLYEGFGLPVLEAMRYGCPVITSNISSLPEAGGDAAVYCNPEDVNDIAAQIEKVISDDSLRERMKKKGYERIKKFSWEKTAKKTLDILKEVATQKIDLLTK